MAASGNGNVASIKVHEPWSSASTYVAAQSQTKGGRHEAAADTGSSVHLEEVFTADRDAQPNDLPGRADEHLHLASNPATVEFTCHPGDTRLLLGLGLGDVVDVDSQQPGAVVSGRFRVVRKETDPATDSAVFTATVAP